MLTKTKMESEQESESENYGPNFLDPPPRLWHVGRVWIHAGAKAETGDKMLQRESGDE